MNPHDIGDPHELVGDIASTATTLAREVESLRAQVAQLKDEVDKDGYGSALEVALRIVDHELDRWRIWPAAQCALYDVRRRLTEELANSQWEKP